MATRPRWTGRFFRDGVRPSVVAAVLLAVVGILFVVLEVLSPSHLYWTGRAVHGTNSGGIVYYQFGGERYTVDAPGAPPAHDTPTTVYLDPGDPGSALVQSPTRWVDAAGVLVWFVAAGALVVAPPLMRKRARRRRAAAPAPDTFGGGFAPGSIARYREQSERPQVPQREQ